MPYTRPTLNAANPLARRTLLKLGAALIAAPAVLKLSSASAASPTPIAPPATITSTVSTTQTPLAIPAVAISSTTSISATSGLAPAPLAAAPRRPFGRSIFNNSAVRAAPGTQAELVRNLKINEVIALSGQVESDDSPSKYNRTWYQTVDGFVHSSLVQPAENLPNKPVDAFPKAGFWGEVTVPSIEMRRAADGAAGLSYMSYFGCVFRVTELRQAADQSVWYHLSDGANANLFARAEAFRQLTAAEFAPISPDVPLSAKRIDVDLKQQIATAYENDKPVFSTRVATGVGGFYTTPGQHSIYEKRPSRRMRGGADSTLYDLPGISWVSYFTRSRIAFHATYWHNDFGAPRSHGCVNMLPEDAQWVYRWTLPNAFDEAAVFTSARTEGSLVKVF